MIITLTEGAAVLNLADIDPDPTNPRADLGDLTGLRDSIAEHGLIEPLIVTASDEGRYLLVANTDRKERAS